MSAFVVRLRQRVDAIRHRLIFVPVVYVAIAVVVVQLLLWVDRGLAEDDLPEIVLTSVSGARSVFSAIAGGLITSVTLLLSMMLIAVQLASSQFSPRSVRNWLGNGVVQHALGLVLGTAVFCLLALRATRDVGEAGSPVVPHVTVSVAVALGVASLIGVVRSVDHVTDGMRVGSVVDRIAAETLEVVGNTRRRDDADGRSVLPHASRQTTMRVPERARPVESPAAGWVQQVEDVAILDAIPAGASVWLAVELGDFVPRHGPLMWVDAPNGDVGDAEQLIGAVAVGDTRTMQEDIEFGLIQLSDIALRAVSPGINDPGTAIDVIERTSDILIEVWATPDPPAGRVADDRRLIRRRQSHEQLLDAAYGPISEHAVDDRRVVAAVVAALRTVRAEVVRRDLPGAVEPLDRMIERLD